MVGYILGIAVVNLKKPACHIQLSTDSVLLSSCFESNEFSSLETDHEDDTLVLDRFCILLKCLGMILPQLCNLLLKLKLVTWELQFQGFT